MATRIKRVTRKMPADKLSGLVAAAAKHALSPDKKTVSGIKRPLQSELKKVLELKKQPSLTSLAINKVVLTEGEVMVAVVVKLGDDFQSVALTLSAE